jgi:hypothetical protein
LVAVSWRHIRGLSSKVDKWEELQKVYVLLYMGILDLERKKQ